MDLLSTPQPVQFTDQLHGVSDVPGPDDRFHVVTEGTTLARGALDGTFDVVDHAVASPELGGHLHIERVLSRGEDTISIELDGQFTEFSEATHRVAGRWAITGGTGVYESLAGSGTYSGTVTVGTETTETETITGTLDGLAFLKASS